MSFITKLRFLPWQIFFLLLLPVVPATDMCVVVGRASLLHEARGTDDQGATEGATSCTHSRTNTQCPLQAVSPLAAAIRGTQRVRTEGLTQTRGRERSVSPEAAVPAVAASLGRLPAGPSQGGRRAARPWSLARAHLHTCQRGRGLLAGGEREGHNRRGGNVVARARPPGGLLRRPGFGGAAGRAAWAQGGGPRPGPTGAYRITRRPTNMPLPSPHTSDGQPSSPASHTPLPLPVRRHCTGRRVRVLGRRAAVRPRAGVLQRRCGPAGGAEGPGRTRHGVHPQVRHALPCLAPPPSPGS